MARKRPLVDPVTTAAGRLAYYCRAASADPEKANEARRDLAAAMCERYFNETLASSPLPLTSKQTDRLVALVQGGGAPTDG